MDNGRVVALPTRNPQCEKSEIEIKKYSFRFVELKGKKGTLQLNLQLVCVWEEIEKMKCDSFITNFV